MKKLLKRIKKSLPRMLTYFIIFTVSILYWEILMFIQTGGLNVSCLYFLFFVPAQALFLTTLCGFGKDIVGRITMPVLIALLTVFYVAQLIYYRNFGSLFSVSMMGMGNDAIGNFWWAVTDTIRGAIGWIILLLVPLIAVVVISIINKPRIKEYHIALHGICLVLTVVLWLLAVLGIRAFGDGRQSAYYLYSDPSVGTDMAAHKLGVMTTALVEGGSYYFGIEQSSTGLTLTEEDDNVLNVEPIPEITDVTDGSEEAEEAVEQTPWIDDRLNFSAAEALADNDELRQLDQFFGERKPTTTNEYTGMFEGYNLIYICAESFWKYACNETVTPTLYKMANNGIVLNNYYNSFYNTTTNGEFAFSTSLWPDVSRVASNGTDVGSFARSAEDYMPQGLGDLFTAQGIPSYGFHNYYGKYYRRILSWPNLGYTCRFTGDNMWFTANWPASDLEMMEQTVDDYINDDQFHAYYMTFSGHGPYTSSNWMYNKNIAEVKQLAGEDTYNDMAAGYLAGELELDKAMEYLLDRLEEAGKLDNTVIVLTGDHYPYYLDEEGRTSLVGYTMDEDWEIYKSDCIIYCAGMDEPIEVDDYCCNVDIAPTILNLFNIPHDSRIMMGRDIFDDTMEHRAMLYNRSFITDLVSYNYETGETVWTDAASSMTQDEKDAYLDKMITRMENEYMASCEVISDNYFLHLYSASGILSDEDVAEEKQRELDAANQDDTFNAEDEAKKAAQEAAKAAAAAEQAAQEAGTDAAAADGTTDAAQTGTDANAAGAQTTDTGTTQAADTGTAQQTTDTGTTQAADNTATTQDAGTTAAQQ